MRTWDEMLEYDEVFHRGSGVLVVLLNIVTLANIVGWYV